MVYKGDAIEPSFLVLSEEDINTLAIEIIPEILFRGRTPQCSGYDRFALGSKTFFFYFLL